MQIDANSTCKYLKLKKGLRPDLSKACCKLMLIATRSDDVKALTALYRLYTEGGKLNIETLKTATKLTGEITGS